MYIYLYVMLVCWYKAMIANRKEKGISTFIATLLLMVLAVSAGVVIYAYVMGYLGGFGGTETLGSMSLDTASITGGTVTAYLRNTGKVELTVNAVYVDGVSVTPSTTTMAEGGVGILTFPLTAVAGKTYTIKVVCTDNTQLSFTVKG